MEYIRVQNNRDLQDVTEFKPFKCLVVIEDDVSDSWRNQVSDWLVDSGCVYMMAWGKDCSVFHDRVDKVCVMKSIDEQEEAFIMTTWHEKETLEEAFFFCKYCAVEDINENKVQNTVILHISDINRDAEFQKLLEEI